MFSKSKIFFGLGKILFLLISKTKFLTIYPEGMATTTPFNNSTRRLNITSEFNEVVSEANDLGKMRAEHFSVKFLLYDGEDEVRKRSVHKDFRRKSAALPEACVFGKINK